jgi:acetyltransferase-like isoleucine patch superfamily enzyme
MDSFYKEHELKDLNFKYVGKNVKISKKAIFYNYDQIEIGDHSRIDDLCMVSGNVKIGKFVHIAPGARISGSKAGAILHDFSGVSYNSTLIANTDDYSGEFLTNPCIPMKYKRYIAAPLILEKHALIASHCLLVPGVTVREGTAIGAMSLVLKSTEPWSIYFGVPAKRVKDRKRNMADLEVQFLEEFNKNL